MLQNCIPTVLKPKFLQLKIMKITPGMRVKCTFLFRRCLISLLSSCSVWSFLSVDTWKKDQKHKSHNDIISRMTASESTKIFMECAEARLPEVVFSLSSVRDTTSWAHYNMVLFIVNVLHDLFLFASTLWLGSTSVSGLVVFGYFASSGYEHNLNSQCCFGQKPALELTAAGSSDRCTGSTQTEGSLQMCNLISHIPGSELFTLNDLDCFSFSI